MANTNTTPAAAGEKDKDKQPPAAAEQPAGMQFVRFVQDYRGKLTEEQFYLEGAVVPFPSERAQALINAGRAKAAKAPKPKAEDEED